MVSGRRGVSGGADDVDVGGPEDVTICAAAGMTPLGVLLCIGNRRRWKDVQGGGWRRSAAATAEAVRYCIQPVLSSPGCSQSSSGTLHETVGGDVESLRERGCWLLRHAVRSSCFLLFGPKCEDRFQRVPCFVSQRRGTQYYCCCAHQSRRAFVVFHSRERRWLGSWFERSNATLRMEPDTTAAGRKECFTAQEP